MRGAETWALLPQVLAHLESPPAQPGSKWGCSGERRVEKELCRAPTGCWSRAICSYPLACSDSSLGHTLVRPIHTSVLSSPTTRLPPLHHSPASPLLPTGLPGFHPPSIHLPNHPAIPCVFTHLPIHLLSGPLPPYPSIHPPTHLSIHLPFIHPSMSPFIYPQNP